MQIAAMWDDLKKQKYKKIGILGGCFDPVHIGHINLAMSAKSAYELNTVFLVPCNTSLWCDKVITTKQIYREQMLRSVCTFYNDFELCTYEYEKQQQVTTFELINYFRQSYPYAELFFIFGEDIIPSISTFKHYDQYPKEDWLKLVFGVYNKSDCGDNNIFEIPEIKLHSKDIRRYIKSGLEYEHLLPGNIGTYIKKNNLYK